MAGKRRAGAVTGPVAGHLRIAGAWLIPNIHGDSAQVIDDLAVANGELAGQFGVAHHLHVVHRPLDELARLRAEDGDVCWRADRGIAELILLDLTGRMPG